MATPHLISLETEALLVLTPLHFKMSWMITYLPSQLPKTLRLSMELGLQIFMVYVNV